MEVKHKLTKVLSQALKSGARFYVESNGRVSNIEFAISDGTVTYREFPSQARIVRVDNADASHLTAREREIIALVLDGFTYRYISRRLYISEGTVKKTVHNAYRKLGVSSRIELLKLQLNL